ncbi:hypothetical protein Cadr_000029853 [Camelus dromedarius]|uniref:Uncharacterized protein n=1 Tax=Camelus dromedarius TaxID=9838 RepID=A0A5N4CCM8_CAMDR|nr:hypothetical protein Cadr_000029853 [Camelus dromedarius]
MCHGGWVAWSSWSTLSADRCSGRGVLDPLWTVRKSG